VNGYDITSCRLPACFDVVTTARFVQAAEVCLDTSPLWSGCDVVDSTSLVLLYDTGGDGSYEDVTTSRIGALLCTSVTSFGQFALGVDLTP
jgi:hypothetical protein